MDRRFLAVALLAPVLGLAACSNEKPYDPTEGYEVEPLEAVLAWRETARGDIVIRVRSNGCTNKESFDVQLTGAQDSGWSFDMALVRLHADRCRALLPQGVLLTWTKEELGLPPSAEVYVANPIESEMGPSSAPNGGDQNGGTPSKKG